MNISVFKDNNLVESVDLSNEILKSSGDETVFFVGRSSECHVSLDSHKISREHAEIKYKNKEWEIKRLSSFSPVLINGENCSEKILQEKDIIKIGPFALHVNNLVKVEEFAGISREPAIDSEPLISDDFNEETVAVEGISIDSPTGSDDISGRDDERQINESQDLSDEEMNSDDDFITGDAEEHDSFQEEDSDDAFDEVPEDDESDGFDDNFSDDGFDDSSALTEMDDDVGESTRVIQAFAKMELEIFGEYAPYEKFSIDTKEVFVGRDPDKCQIVLNDPEVSAVHAVFKKNNITCSVQDLNSGNGTLLNGKRINESVLTNKDEVLIGGTSFTIKITSDFLTQEKSRLMPVEENQVVEVEEIVEVGASFDEEGMSDLAPEGKSSIIADIKNFKNLPPERRKKVIIYGAVIALLVLFLLDSGDEKKKPKKADTKKSNLLEQPNKDLSKKDKMLKKLSKEELEFVESRYILAKEQIDVGKYREAVNELDKVFALVPDYKQSKQLYEIAKEGFLKLEEEEKKRRAEIQRKKREAKVKILVTNAKEAVKEFQVVRARALFTEILTIDPENFDVPLLKQQIEAHERKLEREALAKAEKESERRRQVDQLAPGKKLFLQKQWYKAILKLENFISKKGLDEDLIKDATEMLSTSKINLNRIVSPLLGKANSLKEGQDLKGAYENYIKILNVDPSNLEALNESNDIKEKLKNRSKKIYREAIISESLSLFEDAKEKFQEVQQVSPSDGEYYKKATEKLKDYLE